MCKKTLIEPGTIQETLLLPLWGRAIESKKDKSKFVDPKAIEIINKIDYDFTTINEKINIISQLSWIARSIHVDNAINFFIEKYPKATIVNIGCGLDTTSERINNSNVQFYNLDLPDVIELREKLFGLNVQGKSIASSCFDQNWIENLKADDGLLFIAAGVFYFFKENQIKDFFIRLANYFKKSEVFFDSASPLGIKIANKDVLKKSGIDEKVILNWGLKTGKIIENWDKRISLIKEFPIFTGFKKGYSLKIKTGLWLSDILKILSMVHLRIGE